MRVLDLFCGMGGWSIPFLEDGDEVWGVDIEYLGYPGWFIQADIRTLDGKIFHGFDAILGSPPCSEFSNLVHLRAIKYGQAQDIEKGLALIHEFTRIVKEAEPKFYGMENVSNLERYYPVKPIYRFRLGKGGRRSLWGNIPIPLSNDYRFTMLNQRVHPRSLRAKIPYPIARFICDVVKGRTPPFPVEKQNGPDDMI